MAAAAQLDAMEATRKLFLRARALALAQRAKLYALDELEQCTMRLRRVCLASIPSLAAGATSWRRPGTASSVLCCAVL